MKTIEKERYSKLEKIEEEEFEKRKKKVKSLKKNINSKTIEKTPRNY